MRQSMVGLRAALGPRTLVLVAGMMTALGAHAAEQGAPGCDAACIRGASDRAVAACVPQIEARAPTDFDWLNRPVPGIFQQAEQPAGSDPVVLYRGDTIRFQTAQKDWARMSYECGYDTRTNRVVSLKMHPGRLAAHLEPVAGSVVLPGAPPAQAQGRMTPIPQGTAIAEGTAPGAGSAAAAPGAPATPRKVPTPRVGEPSPIEIQQQSPRVRP